MCATNRKNQWARLWALLLSLVMLVGLLTGCNNTQEPGDGQDRAPEVPAPEDPGEYLEYMTHKGIVALTDGSFGIGGLFDGSTGMSARVKLTLGDYLLETMEKETGTDMSFLKNVQLEMQTGTRDAVTRQKVGISLNDAPPLTLDALLDQANGTLYFGISELSGQYLKASLGDLGMGQGQASMMPAVMQQLAPLREAMPSREELVQVLDKYIGLAVGQLNNIQRTTQNVTLEGVSQQLTVLTVTISQQEALNCAEVILENLKTDTQVRQILLDIDEAMAELAEANGESYERITAADYERTFEQLKEELKTIQTDDDDSKLILRLYTDDEHQLAGLSLSIDQEQLFGWLAVLGGNDFRFEAQLDTLQITGTGTKTDRQFTVVSDGKQQLTLQVRNYDPQSNRNGNCSLDLLLEPGPAMLETMDKDTKAMLEQLGGQLTIGILIEGSGQTGRISVDLMIADSSLFAFDVTVQAAQVDVSIPQNVADMHSQYDMMNWLAGINIDTLLNNLAAAGVPEEMLMEMVGEMLAD